MDNFGVPGLDIIQHPGGRFRMQGQNRFRYLNSTASVTRTTTQTSFAVNVFTAITFDSETWDTDTLHDNVTQPTRITAAIAGKYIVTGTAYLVSNVAVTPASSYLAIAVNGSIKYEAGTLYDVAVTGNIIAIAGIVSLAANDYVELMVDMVAASGNFDVNSTIPPKLAIAYIGE